MERSIRISVSSLSNNIKRYRPDRDVLTMIDGGLSSTQGAVLGFLAFRESKDTFQRDIEKNFQIRRSTASGILQLMEKKGLICKSSVLSDKRLKKLELTEKGRGICEAVNKEIVASEEELRKGLTQEELAAFFSVIDKIKKNVGES